LSSAGESVFEYLLPLQGEHLGFAKAGKQQQLIEHPMDWVFQLLFNHLACLSTTRLRLSDTRPDHERLERIH
jgi:hypothetical protein